MNDRPEGMVLWLTGLPASGKSTLAARLLERLGEAGRVTMWIDSDDLRAVITPKATYSEEERDMFYTALGYVAALSAHGGAVAVVSATAPRRLYRDAARMRVDRFVEVYLRCSEALRRARDYKGLYTRADDGSISSLPGVNAPYEAPLSPELTLDSGQLDPEELADLVMEAIR